MKKYVILLAVYALLSGCSTLDLGRTDIVDSRQITGTYNLVLVGGTFVADAERLVILDADDDDISFRPITGPGRVKILSGLTAGEALQKAEAFFSEHCAYDGYQIKKLSMPGGEFVGYELTPDYPPSLCENGNVLQVSYGQGDEGEIKVYTWLLLKRDRGGSKIDSPVVPEK